jgi:hypothetical protein
MITIAREYLLRVDRHECGGRSDQRECNQKVAEDFSHL